MPTIPVYVSTETLVQINELAKKEKTSVGRLCSYMIRNFMAYYQAQQAAAQESGNECQD